MLTRTARDVLALCTWCFGISLCLRCQCYPGLHCMWCFSVHVDHGQGHNSGKSSAAPFSNTSTNYSNSSLHTHTHKHIECTHTCIHQPHHPWTPYHHHPLPTHTHDDTCPYNHPHPHLPSSMGSPRSVDKMYLLRNKVKAEKMYHSTRKEKALTFIRPVCWNRKSSVPELTIKKASFSSPHTWIVVQKRLRLTWGWFGPVGMYSAGAGK